LQERRGEVEVIPGVYEFRWEAGHVIFLGVFYAVIIALLWTLAVAVRRSLEDLRREKIEAIRWREDFESLPAESRVCRHCFTGELRARICPNGFDCRTCSTHNALLARRPPFSPSPLTAEEDSVHEFRIAPDCLYHRGHAWVHPEQDGTVTIGLDDLAERLVGGPDSITLPATGARLEANGAGWRMRKGGARVRVLCPLDGVVVERGGPSAGWYLRLRPRDGAPDMGHLLRGAEVRPWLAHELERLRSVLSSGSIGASMRNGGAPVRDLCADVPEQARDGVLREAFLDP